MYPLYAYSITMYPLYVLPFNNHVPPSMPMQLLYPLYSIQLPCIPSMPFNYHVPPSMPFNYHVPPLCHSITMYPLYAIQLNHVPPLCLFNMYNPKSPGPSAREAPDKWPWCRLKKPARILQTPSFWE